MLFTDERLAPARPGLRSSSGMRRGAAERRFAVGLVNGEVYIYVKVRERFTGTSIPITGFWRESEALDEGQIRRGIRVLGEVVDRVGGS